jgi:galactokinase/mevalonate kinase-like predicted kinase
LGCSAILAAGVVRGLREIARLPTDLPQLLARSYLCERFYGRSGYQDIIGGAIGGVKLLEADACTGLFCPRVERLTVSVEQMAAISEHVLLFHTGQARQRPPYLLTIAAKYFTRSAGYMHAYENGKQLTYAMREALLTGDWRRLGDLVSQYWEDRESFEEGVMPEGARRLRGQLRPYSYGAALCGGGHGGYMMVILRPGMRDAALRHLSSSGVRADQVLDYRLTDEGLLVEVG